jgi:UDPglucose 6-dehydrogenase
MRDAPSLAIVPALIARGARVRAYDPEGMEQARKMMAVETCSDAYEPMKGADGLVLLTEWNEFRALNLVRVRELLNRNLIVDLRNIYNPAQMAFYGFNYVSIGRRAVRAQTQAEAVAAE